MPDWTLTVGGLTKTCAAWGLSDPVLEEQSFDVSSVTFTTVHHFSGAPIFALRAAGILKLGDDIVFQGRFDKPVRSAQGAKSTITYTLKDALWHMANLPRMQTWGAGAGFTLPLAINFQKIDGTSMNLAEALEDVVDYAQSKGVAIQFGSAANIGIAPGAKDSADKTCLQALQGLREWLPDVATQIDHTTTPPTLHFIRRGDAALHTLATGLFGDGIQIEEQTEVQASQVVINYIVRGADGDTPTTELVRDAYPPGSVGDVENAVAVSVEKRGVMRVFHHVELWTRAISASSIAWWELPEHAPWLTGASGGSYDIVDGDYEGMAYEITGGSVPGWLPESAGQTSIAARAVNFNYGGVFHESHDLRCTVASTDLAAGVYKSPPEVTDAEDIPTGVAQAYYEAVSVLHYAGTLRVPSAQLTAPLIRVGDVINLTGGEAAARGWTTMRAQIYRVVTNLQQRTVEITFGAPLHLSLQNLGALMGLTKKHKDSRDNRTADESAKETEPKKGPAATPNSNTINSPGGVVQRGPLQAYSYNSSGQWTVTSALVNSEPITTPAGAPFSDVPPPLSSLAAGKIYLELLWDIKFTEGYLRAAEFLTAKIKVDTTVPANSHEEIIDDEFGEWIFNVEVATLEDGVPHSNNFVSSMTYVIEDTSDEDNANCTIRGFQA